MLEEYSRERGVIMNCLEMAEQIYFYTSGHPFLVSKLCKVIDENFEEDQDWEYLGIEKAVKQTLQERNTNFESLIKNLENETALYQMIYDLLLAGVQKTYNLDHPLIQLGQIYGVFKNQSGRLVIHNRIYEQRIYNYIDSKKRKRMFFDFLPRREK